MMPSRPPRERVQMENLAAGRAGSQGSKGVVPWEKSSTSQPKNHMIEKHDGVCTELTSMCQCNAVPSEMGG